MQIPQRLAYILERDLELDGAGKLSITQLEPWINHSNLPFFPEYTKHDIGHIESVLRTAVSLVRDEAWESITPADASVLVLSVLLHDCAMHLLEDGFISLLDPSRSKQCIPGMGDTPWNLLWEDFCSEASRFDGRSLMRIFGEALPIRRPPLDPKLMTMKDRLLIGEFLLRHHPRLAQEIALFGVPTLGNRPLAFQGLSDSKNYIAALSGLIARSHGADVRSFLPYLRDNFDIRQYKGVHAVFLMTVLRVADYIQMDAERAPAQVLQVKQLSSPVSQGEWKAHHAIKDIRHTHEDPEALFIDALPENAQTFFRVQSWIKGIQKELDDSWAVLGEVYGRYEGLSKLGLVLRRIRSTLDNIDELSEKLSYLPLKASFQGSDADLLKLLIEPLYGNRPEIGLRELIQNSVDAVRELTQYLRDIPSRGEVPLNDQDSDVVVSIDTTNSGETWVSVSDKGIGMTPQIVVEYFLKAGASFRRSEDWKKLFETSDGKSKVLRAGRFGVGALASFLLGSELQVSTRHIDEAEGVEFNATVEAELIELKRVDRPVGTTVRIRIPDVAHFRTTDWDWYCLSNPSVSRKIGGRDLPQRHRLPGAGETLPPEWRRIAHPDYQDILWTYSAETPELVCNGIKIRTTSWHRSSRDWARRFGLQVPKESVFDPDGRLPLNLQRTDMAASSFPFEHLLVPEVIRDFIAYCLVHGPTQIRINEHSETYRGTASKTHGSYDSGPRLPWYFTDSGFGFLDAFILQREGFESLLVVKQGAHGLTLPAELELGHSGPTIVLSQHANLVELEKWFRKMLEYAAFTGVENAKEDWDIGGEDVVRTLKRKGARILISNSSWDILASSPKVPKRLQRLMATDWNRDGWVLFRIGNCPDAKFDFEHFIERTSTQEESVIAEIYLDTTPEVEPSPIAIKWLEILKASEIPYNVTQRRQDFQHAYMELAPYIQAHTANRGFEASTS